ncbi:MAG: hypothetical protein C4530_14985 [Desulfobacteraceae bacterium]|nr:MAG: hypothetical protein C4530_14985 [Desulfobacteraceae bacterium]
MTGDCLRLEDLRITPQKTGAQTFSKVSFPIRYGCFSEVRTSDYIFQFNLNGEIKFIQGRGRRWPHPSEWLKRTVGNDWIYYSTGGYKGVFSLFGEYYLPCLSYPSNPILRTYAFDDDVFSEALAAWKKTLAQLKSCSRSSISGEMRALLENIAANDENALRKKADRFHAALEGPVSVLPPDTRHVDYDVIPLIVADGCLYNCRFCRVKSGRRFMPRSREDILLQIQQLKILYGRDLANYNAIFLGRHDALHAPAELIEFAAVNAYEALELKRSNLKGANLFLFGSVDSFMRATEVFLSRLNRLPFYSYINLGLESADPETLLFLGKPVGAASVRDAYARMNHVNRTYENIEVSANFVLGESLPRSHGTALLKLLENGIDQTYTKGAVYLSPLENGGTGKETLNQFFSFKNLSRLPVFIYLIQRL